MSSYVPTSIDQTSDRPKKKRATSPTSLQRESLSRLLNRDPLKPLHIPPPPSTTSTSPAPPPEFVTHVQGSSAGAGSGEFHVYKAARRREYDRLAAMDAESVREREMSEFEARREGFRREDEEKTAKNRARRMKKKKVRGKGDKMEEEEGVNAAQNGARPESSGGTDPDGNGVKADVKVVKSKGLLIHDDD
ncbi:DUF1168-domain-containing protein [Saitoella complicata NRRL Y-17804]|uniref:DUF1168-domain-containing protein n=1 Tax=Saitoella complicata (strain BCRC 22490 / CBS 7301 / JCM 7358 / NBRC 10748 / NRRL Y-17804) TaxID=698492 RepID=UPI000868081F|nr:DUF1168-domain-containing protein [Saitoella complicata NRRL Y-17804]ODQ54726.1 DUF1168-domain-containing protein [Saitoella complicata NRRL Y-17804]